VNTILPGAGRNAMSEKLEALSTLTVAELKQSWRSLYESEPPIRIGRELLLRAVAYHMQERASGGLKPSTKQLLERLACNVSCGKSLKLSATPTVSVGTVLIREWQGTTHKVTVLERGVIYRTQQYRSLSEVARLITGSRWSGPLFFGLRSNATRHSSKVRRAKAGVW
jgi:Protein of unknown function (DUF2924)